MSVIDYDIHGIIGVRLLDPLDSDIRAIEKQISFPQTSLQREPDIIIRFVPRLDTPALTYLGLYAGYTSEGFYLLKSSKKPCKVRIPFEHVGGKCEIVCQSGLRSVPLLIAILNLTFLGKGFLPLHASGFIYEGVGNVVTGWAKGGKTESLLSFSQHGAVYVSDEWTVFSADGERMFGLIEPIRLWNWHLSQIPRLQKKKSTRDKLVFGTINGLDGLYNLLEKIGLKSLFPVKVLGEMLPALKRQLNIRIAPQELFEGRLQQQARPENVFLVMSHQKDTIEVEPIPAAEIAERMISSNEYEQIVLTEQYKAFRFAFPERKNELIENMHQIQLELLRKIFDGKPAYRVVHPYPVSFAALFKKMKPFCVKASNAIPLEKA